MNTRKVVYARLQNTDAHIPGLGSLGNVLPPKHKTFDLDMECTEHLLFVKIKDKFKVYEAVIPMTNVQIALLGEKDE